jgi:hypothetical protein
MAWPELHDGSAIDIRTVDDAVRFLTRHKVKPPDSYRGAYLVERGDGSAFKLKLEGFHDSELREIHDRVTGSSRRRNPGRRDTNIYHPAPDDTSLRRDGTPFPHHCKHGLAPSKACHTCHPRSDCEICAEFHENPCKGWRSPPRERDNPGDDWRKRQRLLDRVAYLTAELRDKNASSEEWVELQDMVHKMNRDGEIDNRDTEYLLAEMQRVRRGRQNPGRFVNRPPRERDNPGRFVNRPPRENPGLHAAIESAAKRTAMTGTAPRSGEVADWIRQYPKTWRQMVARYSR